jgi:ankyrin repeat protein
LYDTDYSLHAREEMPPSKKQRGQAARRGQPAGGGQLLSAVREGDTAGVARLLAAGADPNALVPGQTVSGKVVQSTALCQAVRHGRLEVLRLLLEGGADPSLTGSDGITPMMAMATQGELEVLRLLLGRGAAVDAVEPGEGCTAFHIACMLNQADYAEALARAGCDVGLKDKSGHTGRERAEARGHVAVVARLRAVVAEQLRAAQVAGSTPAPEPAAVIGDGGAAAQLMMAVREGDGAAVVRLLAAGADPNASVAVRTASGEAVQTTALCEAAGCGRLEAARLLLDGGADPSIVGGDGFTPLMEAAGCGQLEVLRLLLEWGVVVDAVDPSDGGTAFHSACVLNQADCAEELARAGCDVGFKDESGHTGRELAEEEGHVAVVERLRAVLAEQLRAAQAAGPAPASEPAAVIGDGGPAAQLMMVVREGDGAAVARLLAAGADPNALVAVRTASGRLAQETVLREAAAHGRLEAARLLLDGGADPSRACGDGFTPLINAAMAGQLEVLRLLLARGAAVDAADPGAGGTAFHSACANNEAVCVEALARAGCDISLKNKSGHTGREVAEALESKEVARRLRALARQSFVGVLVELAGLVGAAEHNGKRATVMSERPSRGHHTSVFLPRAHVVCTLCEHRRTLCVTAEWWWNCPPPPPPPPPPPTVPGAALLAGEAALHARAAGAAGRGRRRGEAHGRAAGELCAGAPAGRHAVRPGQEAPLAPAAAVRCSSRVV